MRECWQTPDGGNIIDLEVISEDDDASALLVSTDKGNNYVVPKESLKFEEKGGDSK